MNGDVCTECGGPHPACDHGFDWDKKLFMDGSLLGWCEALRTSSTGMGDPLPDEEVFQIRAYMKRRLAKWREPSSYWDKLVRQLCEHSLRAYHGEHPEEAAE